MGERRLVVVSNRLPIVLERQKTGKWDIGPGAGGLITALGPVLRNRGGLWIGWLGASSEKLADFPGLDELLKRGAEETGYALSPVHLSSEEVQNFYFGFSNQILWPLFHDFPTRCNFDPAYWQAYEWVNRKFALAILDNTTEEDFVWVHDYQLILAGSELIKMGRKRHTGFFLHIPFPPLDVFINLPWRFAILDALMQYDLIGFQTERDRRNFIGCVHALTRGSRVLGKGHVCKLVTPDREVRVGSFPSASTSKSLPACRQVSRRPSRPKRYGPTCQTANSSSESTDSTTLKASRTGSTLWSMPSRGTPTCAVGSLLSR